VIYILVPTFARIKDTENFLSSIHKCIDKDYLILIMDDHPDKVTFKSIQQNKHVKILLSEKELWWVGCINLGIQTLFDNYGLKDDDIVVFANNDVQINRDSFNLLCSELSDRETQIVHPRTFDQDKLEVSSGAKILSLFPYVTSHPKNFSAAKQAIDMGTARFLMMNGSVLQQVGYINDNLVQYGGDNDFTYSARRLHNINTYILRDAECRLDDSSTGLKNHNIKDVKELYKSFFSIKSPNNIKYRYRLFKKFYGNIGAFFITFSISFNTIVKFIFR
jgi:GT2 family glycosyltransferase